MNNGTGKCGTPAPRNGHATEGQSRETARDVRQQRVDALLARLATLSELEWCLTATGIRMPSEFLTDDDEQDGRLKHACPLARLAAGASDETIAALMSAEEPDPAGDAQAEFAAWVCEERETLERIETARTMSPGARLREAILGVTAEHPDDPGATLLIGTDTDTAMRVAAAADRPGNELTGQLVAALSSQHNELRAECLNDPDFQTHLTSA